MSRPWRIEFKGTLYHVFSRGNEQEDIFWDEEYRICFIYLMVKMSDRFNVDIFVCVLMDNHIILRTNDPNFPKAMAVAESYLYKTF